MKRIVPLFVVFLLLCGAALAAEAPEAVAQTLLTAQPDESAESLLSRLSGLHEAAPGAKEITIASSTLPLSDRQRVEEGSPQVRIVWQNELHGVTVRTGDTYADFGGIKSIDLTAMHNLLGWYPELEKVDMFEARMPLADMAFLFDAHRQIDLGFTLRISEHVVRTDVTAFSTLHSKRDPRHNTAQLSNLRMCRHLRALDIGHNSVDNVDWLYDLPELRILIIALNKITDLTPVGSLEHLEYLETFTNKITDISPLLNCKKLLDLNIGFNRIEDISPLYEMHQLERLWMYSFRHINVDGTTPEIRAKLKEALPNCEFNFHNYPTLAGWREHPRYFTMYDIFQTNVWRPWDEAALAKK